MIYAASFAPAAGGVIVVTFRDIPEAITQGDAEDEALEMARDALVTALEFYVEDWRPVPPPSPVREGERAVALPLVVTAKILLLNQMIGARVRQADLARRMGIRPQEVTRLLSLRHGTKIDTVAAAVAALGVELDLTVRGTP